MVYSKLAGIEILKYTEGTTIKGGTVNNYNSQEFETIFTIDEESFTPACHQAIYFSDVIPIFKCNKNGSILLEKNWNKSLGEMEQGDCVLCTIQLVESTSNRKYYTITIKII